MTICAYLGTCCQRLLCLRRCCADSSRCRDFAATATHVLGRAGVGRRAHLAWGRHTMRAAFAWRGRVSQITIRALRPLLLPGRLRWVPLASISHKPLAPGTHPGHQSQASRLRMADTRVPGIVVEGMDNPHRLPFRLIDGNHRLAKMRGAGWAQGYAHVPGHAVADWHTTPNGHTNNRHTGHTGHTGAAHTANTTSTGYTAHSANNAHNAHSTHAAHTAHAAHAAHAAHTTHAAPAGHPPSVPPCVHRDRPTHALFFVLTLEEVQSHITPTDNNALVGVRVRCPDGALPGTLVTVHVHGWDHAIQVICPDNAVPGVLMEVEVSESLRRQATRGKGGNGGKGGKGGSGGGAQGGSGGAGAGAGAGGAGVGAGAGAGAGDIESRAGSGGGGGGCGCGGDGREVSGILGDSECGGERTTESKVELGVETKEIEGTYGGRMVLGPMAVDSVAANTVAADSLLANTMAAADAMAVGPAVVMLTIPSRAARAAAAAVAAAAWRVEEGGDGEDGKTKKRGKTETGKKRGKRDDMAMTVLDPFTGMALMFTPPRGSYVGQTVALPALPTNDPRWGRRGRAGRGGVGRGGAAVTAVAATVDAVEMKVGGDGDCEEGVYDIGIANTGPGTDMDTDTDMERGKEGGLEMGRRCGSSKRLLRACDVITVDADPPWLWVTNNGVPMI